MSTAPADDRADDAGTPAAVTAYQVGGFAAVVLLGVAMLQAGADRWALVPTLVGAAGLAFRWRLAPLGLVAAVAAGQLAPLWLFGPLALRRASLVGDLVLVAAVLAYLVAQYRLFGLQTKGRKRIDAEVDVPRLKVAAS